jgi:predicted amidohydrolase YtcJ
VTRFALLFAFGISLFACDRPGPAIDVPPADLVLTGGRIVTLDPLEPEATALAARDGRIVALGSDAEIAAYTGAKTRRIELGGRLAVPGLIESHAHFSGIGQAAQRLRLAGEPSWEAIVARVAEAVSKAKPGDWVLGHGWHQEKWTAPPAPEVEGFPVHDALSAVSPDNPVALSHASGHAIFVNGAALAAAGIGDGTPNPPGGEILRDAAGRATGLLREEAEGLVFAAYGQWLAAAPAAETEAREREALRLADREVLSKGITSFHDAGSPYAEVERIAAMANAGELGVRLYVMIRDSVANHREKLAATRRVAAANGRLTVRAIKASIDGALGSRGAWLLAPYSDAPHSTGLATTPPETIRELAQLALANDYQLCVHAIGDRANRETLDIYRDAFATAPEKKELRWRIEHAQHLDPADVARFAELGVVAAMQGIHCTSDAPFVPARLGDERARAGAYVWRKLVDSGAVIANGTDAPVEDVDPIASFHATVTRRLGDGSTFYPDQALTRLEALATYTKNAAFAAFEEKEKGTLEVGKLADVTVLTKDILTVPENEILDARAAYTIVGGNVLYEAPPTGR